MTKIIPNKTLVRWWSNSNGSRKQREGTILYFCPANTDPMVVLGYSVANPMPDNYRFQNNKPSIYDRYLIAVLRGGKSKIIYIMAPRIETVHAHPFNQEKLMEAIVLPSKEAEKHDGAR